MALKMPITLNLIFIPFLLDSIVAVIFFGVLIYQFYLALPSEDLQIPRNFWSRALKMRTFDFFLRLSRDLFTTNVLTPLFAFKFGLQQAGLFYLISTISISLQTVIKAAVGHPGNALFAALKNRSFIEKQEAFGLLVTKLMTIVIPCIIFTGFNYPLLHHYSILKNCTERTILTIVVYFFLIISELFFILYEYLYIIEEAVYKLFFFKFIEFVFFYLFIVMYHHDSPLPLLLTLIGIRILSFLLIALHAFYSWKIKPLMQIKVELVAASLGLALIGLLILR